MATTPTNLPIPSEDPRDLKFNAGKLDEAMTSDAHYYVDRFEVKRWTIAGFQFTAEEAIRNYGYITMDSFEDGATLTLPNQVLRYEATGEYYRWDGAFPKVVAAGSTPASTGGVGIGAWVSVGDATLRQDLATAATGKGANLVAYKSPVAGAIATTLQLKEAEWVSVYDFGAKAQAGFDNAAAFALMKTAAQAGSTILFPPGVYETSVEITFTSPVKLLGTPGTRIKLMAPGKPHVVCMDFRGTDGAGWAYGAHMENFVLDGNGNAVDGLSLRGTISSRYNNIRTTNVTRAGLHCWWTQLNVYENFQCSKNVEAFTTTPVNGILIDCEFGTGNDRGTSADTFINPEIEHVSGTGIKGVFSSNTLFINGTSEGNNIGIEFGHPTDVRYQAVSNTVTGMDLEVNSATDILLHKTTYANTFNGLMAGYSSPAIQVQGSFSNKWIGGTCSGIDFNSDSHDNRVYGVSLLGSGAIITNAGTRNRFTDCFNITNGSVHESTNPYPNRGNNVLAANETATIDPYRDNLTVVTATGSPINMASATHTMDGARMDVIIHNTSGGTLVVNWSSAFRISGFTAPEAGRHRGLSLVYDANYGYWCIAGMSTADALSV